MEQNFKIKQRSINEAKPFISYQSQNLFKLSHEKKMRKHMVDRVVPGIPNKPLDNIAIKYVSESDSEVSECVSQRESSIVKEHSD